MRSARGTIHASKTARVRVTPLPHDRGAIPRDTARVSRDKGRSGGKKTLVFGDPGRASENMNAFTVSRLIFNAGLPTIR